MEKNYTLIRSARKTIAVQITRDGQIIVRAPLRMAQRDIDRFVASKADWIEKHTQRMARREEPEIIPFSASEIAELVRRAKVDIPRRVACHAERVGITYGRVSIRKQVSRWGSCSSKGNLNFNCLLMLCPEDVRDYVVVHELCHRRHMNHGDAFWAEVARYCHDYTACRRWLRQNGTKLIERLRASQGEGGVDDD